jgi:ferrous-iron efflux pump FieF
MSGNHSHNHSHISRSDADAATRFATSFAVAMALLLILLKGYAWFSSGSVALLGSLADSFLDLVTSLVMFVAVRYASLPADEDHRFGHGKAEAVAALIQGGLTIGSAILLAYMSVLRFVDGQKVEAPEEGIVVSVIAILTTLILVWVQRRAIAKTASVAIEADHAHYQGDVLLNITVIVALVLESYVHLRGADNVFGVIIAVVILVNGYRAVRRAWDMLMDKSWPDSECAQLLDLVKAHPEVRHVHELRARTSGFDKFADFHIWVDPQLTVAQGHRIAHDVEDMLAKQFPHTDFLIHVEPDSPSERHDH